MSLRPSWTAQLHSTRGDVRLCQKNPNPRFFREVRARGQLSAALPRQLLVLNRRPAQHCLAVCNQCSSHPPRWMRRKFRSEKPLSRSRESLGESYLRLQVAQRRRQSKNHLPPTSHLTSTIRAAHRLLAPPSSRSAPAPAEPHPPTPCSAVGYICHCYVLARVRSRSPLHRNNEILTFQCLHAIQMTRSLPDDSYERYDHMWHAGRARGSIN